LGQPELGPVPVSCPAESPVGPAWPPREVVQERAASVEQAVRQRPVLVQESARQPARASVQEVAAQRQQQAVLALELEGQRPPALVPEAAQPQPRAVSALAEMAEEPVWLARPL
jgi:hypothetical protein